jgi:hypothetical protein
MRALLLSGAVVAGLMVSGCAISAPTAQVGECLDIAVDASTVTELSGFDCSQEHDAEVYFVGVVTRQKFDPVAVADDAATMCRSEFTTFIGLPYEESALDIYYLYPQADSWENGDREVICAVYTPNTETGRLTRTTGTLAGAAR